MTPWRVLFVAFVLFVLGVLSLMARQRRLQEDREREQRFFDEHIGTPQYREEFKKADERLQSSADERRQQADAKKREAARIAAGARPEEKPIIRLVG